MSLLRTVEPAPRDPILGLNEAYAADTRPTKVNLGVGVYFDADGKLPLMRAVREAENARLAEPVAHGYLPIDGLPAYDQAVQHLLFGAESAAVSERRVVTVQGAGRHRCAEGRRGLPQAHRARRPRSPSARPAGPTTAASSRTPGSRWSTTPTTTAASHGVDVDAMLAALDGYAAGTIVVLHACCHNPTGVDLDDAQWQPGDRAHAGARAGAVPGHRLPGLRRRHRAGRRRRAPVRGQRPAGVRGQLVLQVVLAVRRARGRAVGGHRQRRRGRARARPSSSAWCAPTIPTRPPTVPPWSARVLGTPDLRAQWERGAGPDARAHPRHAPRPGATLAGAWRPGRFRLHRTPARHVFLLRARAPTRWRGWPRNSASTPSASGRICVAAFNEGNLDTVAAAIAAVSA